MLDGRDHSFAPCHRSNSTQNQFFECHNVIRTYKSLLLLGLFNFSSGGGEEAKVFYIYQNLTMRAIFGGFIRSSSYYRTSHFGGALTFSPPTFSPSDNSTHTVSPSDNWTLELSDPHLFGPCIV
jgi:hypothetical protein